jgi:signal transduction histidine kinase
MHPAHSDLPVAANFNLGPAMIAVPNSGQPQSSSGETAEVLRHQVEALQSQIDQMHRMAMLGELTAMTTHEFNNLLMTMLNYAKIGLRHKDEATRDKALQRIFDAASKASRLTCGVLALARNRTGSREPTDLRRVVEDSVLLMEREFRKYQVQLEVDVQDVPQVLAAGNELQRVLINLLVNARQATPAGGQVRVSLKEDTQTGEVLLSVRDNGSGIAPSVLPRIFDPHFTTKQGPDASGRGGSGLGLAACKQVIDAHGGRIRVDSSLGKGTLFTIRLSKVDHPGSRGELA